MKWYVYAIFAAFFIGLALGYFATRVTSTDLAHLDQLLAEQRAELQAEADRRIAQYRERAEGAEERASRLQHRVGELEKEIGSIVDSIVGSGEAIGEIATGIGNASRTSIRVADGIGRVEDRVRLVRESLESGTW